MRDPHSKFEELHETLPAPPLVDHKRNTIAFHGGLYAFPDYDEEQMNAMSEKMVEVNQSGKYSQLQNLIERLAPFKVGLAKRRKPGERISRRWEIARQ